MSTSQLPGPQNNFPTTLWTTVLSSAGSSRESQAALENLCRAYWQPLYVFARRSGLARHDAQDVVQGFIQRLLERGDLAQVSPERGRFRAYLLAGLRNFMIKQFEHDRAAKRGGGKAILSLDIEDAEHWAVQDRSVASAELAYDRQWARTVLSRALERMWIEYKARNKETFFETLVPFLEGAEAKAYDAVAPGLGMKKGAVAVAVHRMRSRLQELLRAEVLQTVGNSEEMEGELRDLLETLARG
jgi:RNA polymerase sigma factor (sigma-70 family)